MVYPWLPMELPADTVPSELRRGAEVLAFEQLVYGAPYAPEWLARAAGRYACLEGRLGDFYELAPLLILDIAAVSTCPKQLASKAAYNFANQECPGRVAVEAIQVDGDVYIHNVAVL